MRSSQAFLCVGAAVLLAACSQSPKSASAPAQGDARPPVPTRPALALEAPKLSDDKPRDYPGLHNVVAYHEGYYSGGVPEGAAGFDALAAMGIKTIISVDGAEPEVELAHARGIRYIHLPISYAGFDEQRKRELVRASRDALAEGPVYVHCHHGKHRSAGAAATVAASLGWATPVAMVERMKVSGTAPSYKGLYECTASATVLGSGVIDAVPAEFPEISHPVGFVKAMVEIDELSENLKMIEKAGWAAPAEHPALAPAAEAGKLADLLRFVAQGDRAKSKPAEFAALLARNSEQAAALEEMLIAPGEQDSKKLSEQWALVGKSCKECHARYRD